MPTYWLTATDSRLKPLNCHILYHLDVRPTLLRKNGASFSLRKCRVILENIRLENKAYYRLLRVIAAYGTARVLWLSNENVLHGIRNENVLATGLFPLKFPGREQYTNSYKNYTDCFVFDFLFF